jgi:hypothetical protein
MARRERAEGGRSLMRPDSWPLALIRGPRAEGGKVLTSGAKPLLVLLVPPTTPAFAAGTPRADGGRLPPRGAARRASVASATRESATESSAFFASLMPVASCSAVAYPRLSTFASCARACASRQ